MDYPVLITKKINFPLTYKSGALGKLKVGGYCYSTLW